MIPAERIRLLRRHGLENAVIAAILGVETAHVAAHVADPSVDVTVGGGSVDVTGLLPLDGSRAMTGALTWDPDMAGPQVIAPWFSVAPSIDQAAYISIDTQAGGHERSWFDIGAVALTDDILRAGVTTDNAYSFRVRADGSLHWGDGTSALDTHLSRTAPGTLEIDHTLSFKGAVGDVNAGATLEWSDYWYGLVIKGRPGSGDAELYLLNPDDDSNYSNLWPGGSSLQGSDGSYANYGSGGASIAGPYGGTTIGQGGVSLSAHTNGGVNLNAGGCDFLANPDDFAEDALLKRRYFSFGYYNESGSHFNISPDGELAWGDGSSFVNLDTSLQRVAAGVLEIPQHGGGFKLWNDDGSVSKTVRLNHAGTALELV